MVRRDVQFQQGVKSWRMTMIRASQQNTVITRWLSSSGCLRGEENPIGYARQKGSGPIQPQWGDQPKASLRRPPHITPATVGVGDLWSSVGDDREEATAASSLQTLS
jgi:hypothetical protein